jgi:hypothetical protein
VAVGEDLAINRKIEVRDDFSGLLEHDSRTVRNPFPDCPVVGVEHIGVPTLLTVHSWTVRQQLADSPPFTVWPVQIGFLSVCFLNFCLRTVQV